MNGGGNPVQYVPVVGKNGKPLMPCLPVRARELMQKGKATGKWKVGIFYLKLTEREDGTVQQAVGIDPGSKREGFTVKSARHTYLNILSDAVTDVKDRIEARRQMRRARRCRKTPCRSDRSNRSMGGIPPSTRARWQAKLRIADILISMFPVETWIVEDIRAKALKGNRKWNVSFSPLEVGKKWFYDGLKSKGDLILKQGWETKGLRDLLGLKKTSGKMEEKFSAHNVDSWVLAYSVVGGEGKPDNEVIWRLMPLRFHRRQLHYLQPSKGVRRPYGGTISGEFKRGSLANHPRRGLCFIGGTMEGRGISLHGLDDGKRICQNAKPEDLKVLRYSGWRFRNAA